MNTNHYDTLEVSPKASPEVIRAAYKSLMQRHHPDKHTATAQAPDLAARIAQAYGVLSDPQQRATYDLQLQSAAAAATSKNSAEVGSGPASTRHRGAGPRASR